jgi:peptidoglycan/LPS O-acetylase OafA/YrhL
MTALLDSKRARLPALDGLRGLAALVVVLHHLYLTLPTEMQHRVLPFIDWPGLRLLVIGRPAVILFFVLSGFVLTRSLLLCPGMSPLDFILRRCLRIYPPFLVAIAIATSLFGMVAPVGPTHFSAWLNAQWSGAPDMAMVLRAALSQAVGRDTSLDHPIWSLVHEFRFSLALPFVVLAVARFGLKRVGVAAILMSLAGMFAARQGEADPLQSYGGFLFVGDTLLNSLALSTYLSIYFFGGMALAMQFEKLRCVVVAMPAALPACLGVASLALLSDWNEFTAGLGALGAVFLAACLPAAHRLLATAPLAWLGKISYSLYLLHIPVLLAVGHAAPERAPIWAICLAALAAALAIAQIFHSCVEQPAIACARRLPKLGERRHSLAATAARRHAPSR